MLLYSGGIDVGGGGGGVIGWQFLWCGMKMSTMQNRFSRHGSIGYTL